MEVFAQRLKELRIERGIPATKLAKEIKMSPNSIYRIEKGIGDVRMKTLLKVALYFNICLDYFLGRTDKKEELKPNKEIIRLRSLYSIHSK